MLKRLEQHPSPAPLPSPASWFCDFYCRFAPRSAWPTAVPVPGSHIMAPLQVCSAPMGEFISWGAAAAQEAGDGGLHAQGRAGGLMQPWGSACNGTAAWQGLLAPLQLDLVLIWRISSWNTHQHPIPLPHLLGPAFPISLGPLCPSPALWTCSPACSESLCPDRLSDVFLLPPLTRRTPEQLLPTTEQVIQLPVHKVQFITGRAEVWS